MSQAAFVCMSSVTCIRHLRCLKAQCIAVPTGPPEKNYGEELPHMGSSSHYLLFFFSCVYPTSSV